MILTDSLQPHEYSPVNTLVEVLHREFGKLRIKISSRSLERVSVMLYEAMSTRNRAYHRIEHSLNYPKNLSPIAVIAYLFHDIVYWQIDRARHQALRQYMSPYAPTEDGVSELFDALDLNNIDLNEPGILSRLVFGFENRTQITPAEGLNEFLSACVAENVFKGILKPWQMIHLLACIEATIPFQKPVGDVTAPMALRARLKNIATALKLKVSDTDLRAVTTEAIELALHDLNNFAAGDSGLFLKNSWEVIWESNPGLQKETYTVKQFRKAIQQTEAFFSSIDLRLIFPFTLDYPDHRVLTHLWEATEH
ncbi:MAG TPA: hypothetical protein PLH57_06175, partial [Oligoflexia bacterium]|nr:hypothetical protein [Oligoflexia bacterium]